MNKIKQGVVNIKDMLWIKACIKDADRQFGDFADVMCAKRRRYGSEKFGENGIFGLIFNISCYQQADSIV